MNSARNTKDAVNEAYTKVALCASCSGVKDDKAHRLFLLGLGYSPSELQIIPRGSTCLAVGCGNPTALAGLHSGETVLDMGCGAGIDVFLAAGKVGPSGRSIGIDMSKVMVKKALDNSRETPFGNILFSLGDIEALPLKDESIDAVISNASINLSPNKAASFREAYRVLRSGGRMLICDTIRRGKLSPSIQDILTSYGMWVVEALVDEKDYLKLIANAGFADIEIVKESGQGGALPVSSVSVRASKLI
jgi:SAM-dependent methyltransferase